jgi:hypothetical protein
MRRPELVNSGFSLANSESINLCGSAGFVSWSALNEPNLANLEAILDIIISGRAL